MAKLTDEQKSFIVQHLACYDSPQQVADALKDEFGVVAARQQVDWFNPEKHTPAKKWVALFQSTRAAFLEEKAKIPVANRAVRIRRLERMAGKAEHQRNFQLAAQLLEQVAKEVGDLYTNRRTIVPADPTAELAKLLGVDPSEVTQALEASGLESIDTDDGATVH